MLWKQASARSFALASLLTEREQDVWYEVIRKQVKIAVQGVSVDDIKKVVIAYEPIWAIGTGKTATADQANEVCSADP